MGPAAAVAFETLLSCAAHFSEVFCFVYLGMSIPLTPLIYEPKLIVSVILLMLISRALSIFPMSWMVNKFRNKRIKVRWQFMMWFSGLRGAIAFALALN